MSFIDNLRSFLNPTSIVSKPKVKEEKKEAPKVHGFEEDKELYSDYAKKNASDGALDAMEWRSFNVKDNDTGENKRLNVAYDPETKQIAGVSYFDGSVSKDGKTPLAKGYYGKQLVGDFFKKNFNRDSSRYTVTSAPVDRFDYNEFPQEYHNKATVFFDSDADDAFIPSQVFGYDNEGVRWMGDRDRKFDHTSEATGGEGQQDDFIGTYRKYKLGEAAKRNTINVHPDPAKLQGAKGGTAFAQESYLPPLRSMDQIQSYDRNRAQFDAFLDEIAGMEDMRKASDVIREASKRYNNPVFNMVLGWLDDEANTRAESPEWFTEEEDTFQNYVNSLKEELRRYDERLHPSA